MVIIRRQVNPSLDAWQIRSSQRMGRPFICLINSEPLSIFNHQKGNEINNLMMPATPPPPAHTHTHVRTLKTILMSKCQFIVGLIMSTGKGIFVIYDQIIIYDISENKGGFFYCLIRGSCSLSFNSACSVVSLLNHTVRRGFTLFHRGLGLSFHSSHTSDLNLQCRACVPPLYSPCGSAPPLLSLTRIASILALVKLTSSLNYANKAVVICICTARWHVALGVGVEGGGGRVGVGSRFGIHSCGEGS